MFITASLISVAACSFASMCASLAVTFICFDKLLAELRTKDYDEWVRIGSPDGYFWSREGKRWWGTYEARSQFHDHLRRMKKVSGVFLENEESVQALRLLQRSDKACYLSFALFAAALVGLAIRGLD